ncbi:hypothetical protein PMIN01_02291 [Paraphaeosphaeria minitans]|uniref:Uncharacterized protein n=1 Tax=Paraphaeosphaeria minitans TaxID=565426 RepID=A0A9P6KUS3_9PLEO|nr:hypothetical protein PMIN01_02291 [Paraphaeosphaeria minitans]
MPVGDEMRSCRILHLRILRVVDLGASVLEREEAGNPLAIAIVGASVQADGRHEAVRMFLALEAHRAARASVFPLGPLADRHGNVDSVWGGADKLAVVVVRLDGRAAHVICWPRVATDRPSDRTTAEPHNGSQALHKPPPSVTSNAPVGVAAGPIVSQACSSVDEEFATFLGGPWEFIGVASFSACG